MALDHIALTRFRNHAATRFEGTAQINVLVGENGAGKTNVLEAISLLAPGRGMRRAALGEMATGDGASGFAVSARLHSAGGPAVQLGTGMQPGRPGRRVVQVNGAQASAISLGEWLAISWLTPAMDRLFMDPASIRRRYLDRLAVAIDPFHARHASRYENALRERNRLLAETSEPDPQWLDGLEAQMAQHGAMLTQGRASLVAALKDTLQDEPDEPFARPELAYRPGGPVTPADLARHWADERQRDRRASRTLSGPHRDDLQVVMAGKNIAAARCSTGEQKAMLIALTLAHAGLAAKGRPSVVLLDEVAAHLDPVRREALFARLRAIGAQSWLTGTEAAAFSAIRGEQAWWTIHEGAAQQARAHQ